MVAIAVVLLCVIVLAVAAGGCAKGARSPGRTSAAAGEIKAAGPRWSWAQVRSRAHSRSPPIFGSSAGP